MFLLSEISVCFSKPSQVVPKNVNKFGKTNSCLKSAKSTSYILLDRKDLNLDFDISFVRIRLKVGGVTKSRG